MDVMLDTWVLCLRLADRCAIEDVEANAQPVVLTDDGGRTWLDVRTMTDADGHAPEVKEMLLDALTWVLARDLMVVHPAHGYLVRMADKA